MHAFLTMSMSRINFDRHADASNAGADAIDDFTFGPPSVRPVADPAPVGGFSDPDPAIEADAPALHVTAAEFDIARHDAVVTLISPKTGDHRTFKIETARHGDLAGKRIVSLLVGPDTYQGFGFVIDGRVMVWRRCRSDYGGPSLFERYGDLLSRAEYWSGRGVSYQFSLKCRRCQRDLTHPSSLIDGMGPICRQKV